MYKNKNRNIKEGTKWTINDQTLKNVSTKETVQSDIVEPINKVEQWENRREDNPWPPVNGVHIRQIRDFDFELWGPPSQAISFQLGGPVQGVAASQARTRSAALLAVLDVCRGHAVQLHHGLRVSNVRHAGGDLASRHFVMDLQGSEQDAPLAVRFCLSAQREMRKLINDILCKQMGQQTRKPSKVLMHFPPLYGAVKTMKCRCSHEEPTGTLGCWLTFQNSYKTS